jgi:hypothetical protein
MSKRPNGVCSLFNFCNTDLKYPSETTAPVDKTLHPSIEQAKKSRQPTKNFDTSNETLMETLQLSDHPQVVGAQDPSVLFDDKPVFYRRFAGRQRSPRERDVDDIRGSGRLNRLYCHDSSPYVYRGPFRLVDDQIEIENWLLGLRKSINSDLNTDGD